MQTYMHAYTCIHTCIQASSGARVADLIKLFDVDAGTLMTVDDVEFYSEAHTMNACYPCACIQSSALSGTCIVCALLQVLLRAAREARLQRLQADNGCGLYVARHRLTTYYLLLATCYLLLATCYLLLTTYHLLLRSLRRSTQTAAARSATTSSSSSCAVHAYIHAYMHAYIHTYIHTHIHTYIHTCIHTYIHRTSAPTRRAQQASARPPAAASPR